MICPTRFFLLVFYLSTFYYYILILNTQYKLANGLFYEYSRILSEIVNFNEIIHAHNFIMNLPNY